MNQTISAAMTDLLQGLLRQSNARAAFVCDSRGRIVTSAGTWQDELPTLLHDLAPAVFPGTQRMAIELHNPDEAQQVSLPNDALHIVIFWLTEQYFFLMCFGQAINPHAPPVAAIATCQALRALAKGNEKPWWQFWR
jgi:hypothetical protein